MQQRLFKKSQEAFPEHLIAPDNNAFFSGKAKVHIIDVLAEYFYIIRIADSKAHFIAHVNIRNFHRIIAHHFGRHGIDSNGIGTCQDEILHPGNHCSRPCSVAANRAVHYSKNSRMKLLLHSANRRKHF